MAGSYRWYWPWCKVGGEEEKERFVTNDKHFVCCDGDAAAQSLEAHLCWQWRLISVQEGKCQLTYKMERLSDSSSIEYLVGRLPRE